MSIKKKSINISIMMILFSLGVTIFCWIDLSWPIEVKKILNLLFTLATGVFGSSFATLWIFIHEYRQEKQKLLHSIFQETVWIMENNTLPHLERIGFYDPGMKEFMTDKYYIPPVDASAIKHMSKQDRCLYEMCRFVDGILEIGYEKISHILDMVEMVDLWSDTFRRSSKRKNVIHKKICMPLYEVFVTAPAMEDGYLFRYFKDFKINYGYSADQIYQFVSELDKALHCTDGDIKYEWQKKNANLGLHMHEALWIFRDAFFPLTSSTTERRAAMKAFLHDTPYAKIR